MKKEKIDKIFTNILDNETGKEYSKLEDIIFNYFKKDIDETIKEIRKRIDNNKEKYLENGKFKNQYTDKEELKKLISKYDYYDESIRNEEKEYEAYEKRVDEFRYCGYNEEDPDFHGMCLHLNSIDDNIKEMEEEKLKIRKKIEKYDFELIDNVCEELGLYDYDF